MRILWNKLTFWLDRKPSKVPLPLEYLPMF